MAAASQTAPNTLSGSADRTEARSDAGLRGPQKRAIAQAAAEPAKKCPKQQPQQARTTTTAVAAAAAPVATADDSVLDHALQEAQAAQFRIKVGASRWSLWNQVTGKRVGKIETQVKDQDLVHAARLTMDRVNDDQAGGN